MLSHFIITPSIIVTSESRKIVANVDEIRTQVRHFDTDAPFV